MYIKDSNPGEVGHTLRTANQLIGSATAWKSCLSCSQGHAFSLTMTVTERQAGPEGFFSPSFSWSLC